MYDKEESNTIVQKIADHYKISGAHAATMYQIFIESFYDLMEKGNGRVYIEHLGLFKVVKKNAIFTVQFNPSRVLSHVANELAARGMNHSRHKKIEEEKV